jgi:hypothetical protein
MLVLVKLTLVALSQMAEVLEWENLLVNSQKVCERLSKCQRTTQD